MNSIITSNLKEINNACKESLLGYVYYLKGLPKHFSPYAVGGSLVTEDCAEALVNLLAFFDGWNTAQKENEFHREKMLIEFEGGLDWLEAGRIS